MRKLAVILPVAIAALIVALWVADVCSDRKFTVAVVSPAPLYSLPPHEYPKSNPKIAILPVGQPLKVLRVRYGKDFEALKVETEKGQVGWVVGGEGIQVLSRGQQNAG